MILPEDSIAPRNLVCKLNFRLILSLEIRAILCDSEALVKFRNNSKDIIPFRIKIATNLRGGECSKVGPALAKEISCKGHLLESCYFLRCTFEPGLGIAEFDNFLPPTRCDLVTCNYRQDVIDIASDAARSQKSHSLPPEKPNSGLRRTYKQGIRSRCTVCTERAGSCLSYLHVEIAQIDWCHSETYVVIR